MKIKYVKCLSLEVNLLVFKIYKNKENKYVFKVIGCLVDEKSGELTEVTSTKETELRATTETLAEKEIYYYLESINELFNVVITEDDL